MVAMFTAFSPQIERYVNRLGIFDLGMFVSCIVADTSDCLRPDISAEIPNTIAQLMKQCW